MVKERQMDRYDGTKLIVACTNFANPPNNDADNK